MPSRPLAPDAAWRAAGLRYYRLNFFLRQQFGCPVWKISVDGGCNCPNRDGTRGTGGCIFCDPASFSPSRRLSAHSITEQIDVGIRRVSARHRAGRGLSQFLGHEATNMGLSPSAPPERFIAYFQPASNTYAPVPQLRSLFEEAIGHPRVVGLAIGTRPDCVGDDVLDMLAELSRRTWLSIEYGLQTIHDAALDWLNRGHHFDAFLDAVARSRKRGLTLAAHVILGLPGQSRDDMLATARELARMQIDAVKLHNLYAVKDTPLADMVAAGTVELPDFADYVGWVVDFLELLPPGCVIDRLSGEAPPQYLVGPDWCLDKARVRAAIEAELDRRDTWQGRRLEA